MDPHVARLQAQVHTLQRSVQRFGTLATPDLPERQAKERHQEQQAEKETGETQAGAERPSRRGRKS